MPASNGVRSIPVLLVPALLVRCTSPATPPRADPPPVPVGAAVEEAAEPDVARPPAESGPATPREGGATPPPEPPEPPPDPAPILIDLHADVVYRVAERGRAFPEEDGEWTPSRAARAGLTAQFFPLWIPAAEPDPVGRLAVQARAFERMVEAASPGIVVARSAADVRRCAAEGRICALPAIEGADGLGNDPAALDPYADRGLVALGLTWNRSNAFAESAADPRDPGGLTDAGRELVARCNDRGVLIDAAHASRAAFWDAHRLSRSPLVVTHAGLAGVYPHRRNIDDLQLLALARSGGVVGLVFHAPFLGPEDPSAGTGGDRPPLALLVAHFSHARTLGAVDALALGSDFDGGIRPPEGLASVAELPVLLAALRADGWPAEEVAAAAGENVLRLLDAAEAARDGWRPAREYPAPVRCRIPGAAGTCDPLVDRRIVPEAGTAAGTSIRLRGGGPEPGAAAVLEAWGATGAVLAARWTTSDGMEVSGRLSAAPRGGRLVLAPPPAPGGEVEVVIGSADGAETVRLDELAVWWTEPAGAEP
jgi:membrane dipeptidase